MIVAATVREKAATSDVVFGMGCRKGTSLRELRVRATLRPTCAEPASRFHKAGMAPTKLAQDAQPSRLPRCHQARAPATRPAHRQARSIAASNFFDYIASLQMSRRHYGKGSGVPT
jgi:hypothetical protein